MPSPHKLHHDVAKISFIAFAVFANACVEPEKVLTTDSWNSYQSRVGPYFIAYNLPNGDHFSPYPQSTVALSNKSVALGGVGFGARPQGRELANVLFQVSVQRLKNADITEFSAEKFSAALREENELETQRLGSGALTRVTHTAIVRMPDDDWVFRMREDARTGLPWGEEYCLYLADGYFLVVDSLIWPGAAREKRFVDQSRNVLKLITESVKVTMADKR
jgi:hypothetical protein